jgi:hypothetical protein
MMDEQITITEMLTGHAPNALVDEHDDVRHDASDDDDGQGNDNHGGIGGDDGDDDAELEAYLSNYKPPALRSGYNTGPKGVLADYKEHRQQMVYVGGATQSVVAMCLLCLTGWSQSKNDDTSKT